LTTILIGNETSRAPDHDGILELSRIFGMVILDDSQVRIAHTSCTSPAGYHTNYDEPLADKRRRCE
jgi:hypothetical protein